jgi:hypothetical protein
LPTLPLDVELDDELDEEVDEDDVLEVDDVLEELLPAGQVVPPGSQPVPQLTVWQW